MCLMWVWNECGIKLNTKVGGDRGQGDGFTIDGEMHAASIEEYADSMNCECATST